MHRSTRSIILTFFVSTAVGALTVGSYSLQAGQDGREEPTPQQPEAKKEVEASVNAAGSAPAEYVAEAELPAGFPGPGPLDEVVRKSYPAYRAARAKSDGSPDGDGAFWKLFNHIQTHEIAMTAPVEMRMKAGDDEGRPPRQETMAFLYERPDLGAAGTDGDVEVIDYPPLEVLSIAFTGTPDESRIATLTETLRRKLAAFAEGKIETGTRVLGYNSPMVAESRRLYEVQLILADPEVEAEDGDAGSVEAFPGEE